MASGAAIEARAGRPGRDVPADDPAWRHAATALAALCHNLMLTSLPQRILIGGGVALGQPHLLPLLREKLVASIAGYGMATQLAGPMDAYIAYPGLGAMAGPLGTLALARQALAR
jgi:fructokinase